MLDQFEDKLVIDATLEVGKTISDIHAHSLLGMGNEEDISNLEIVISNCSHSVVLTEDPKNKGHYYGPEDFVISPLMEYSIKTNYKDAEITASSTSPPEMEALQTSKEFIEADIQGDLVFLTWSALNTGSFKEYFYIVELVPLDEDAEMIMRFSGSEQKSTVVSFNPELTLSIDDFNFYGDHLIKVYAMSNTYEHLFTPQTNITDNGPTNIDGAYGYFIASSVIETTLEIR